MPKSTRPFESWSSDATSFAVVMGSRSITRQMPVASLIVLVAAAAAISATNGIVRVPVLLRQLAAGGVGRLRLAGMCVCSGNQTDSNPRSSQARAKSSGRMV